MVRSNSQKKEFENAVTLARHLCFIRNPYRNETELRFPESHIYGTGNTNRSKKTVSRYYRQDNLIDRQPLVVLLIFWQYYPCQTNSIFDLRNRNTAYIKEWKLVIGQIVKILVELKWHEKDWIVLYFGSVNLITTRLSYLPKFKLV